MKLIKWALIVAVLLYVTYIVLISFITLPPVAPSAPGAPVAQQSKANPLSNLPEGEAVDADSILSPGFNAPAE